MTGELTAPHTVNLTEFLGGKGAAHLPGFHGATHGGQVLTHGLGRTDILQDDALQAPFSHKVTAHEGNHEVRADETALLVNEHHAVCVSVVDNAGIGLYFLDLLFQGEAVLLDERVGLVVGEAAIQGIKQIMDVLARAEDFLGKEVGHAVGQVHGYGEVAVVLDELAHEGQVIGHDLLLEDLSALGGHRGGFSFIDPGLDLAQTGVITDGLGVRGGHLHAVVLGRVVAGGNLHGGVEAVVGRAEVDHRSGAEANVVHVCSGIVDAFDHGVVDFHGGSAAVSAHKYFAGFQ